MNLYWPPSEHMEYLVDRRVPRPERLAELALARPPRRPRRRWLVLG